MWKASGWNAIHYLLANVIDTVKIVTIPHIPAEIAEIQNTSKAFSKKRKKWEKAFKQMLQATYIVTSDSLLSLK